MILKAGCILINLENKEIALVFRDGEYSFPKCHLEVNETLQECAIRETREETGHNCHIISNNVIAKLNYQNAKGEEILTHFYLAIDDGLTKDVIDEKDKEVTVWRNYQYVETMLNYSNLKELWNKAIREMTLIFNRNVNEDELER